MTIRTSTMPRIYVACLASYNAGTLHGEWIDADQDADAIRAEVATMLRASKHPNIRMRDHECQACKHSWSAQVRFADSTPNLSGEASEQCAECDSRDVISHPSYSSAEEWAIHDYEGFGGIKLSEGESFDNVADLAALIEEHSEELVSAAADCTSDTSADALREVIDDRYQGTYDSESDFAEQLADDIGMVPSDLNPLIAGHIDWEGVARDLRIGGDYEYVRVDGTLYVFRCG